MRDDRRSGILRLSLTLVALAALLVLLATLVKRGVFDQATAVDTVRALGRTTGRLASWQVDTLGRELSRRFGHDLVQLSLLVAGQGRHLVFCQQALGLGPGAVGHELRAAPLPLLVGAPLGETGGQKLAGAQVAHGMLLIEIVVRVARHAIDELYGEGVVVNGKPAD